MKTYKWIVAVLVWGGPLCQTWATNPIKIKCGDLWAIFSEKPSSVKLIDCKESEGQRLATATYRILPIDQRRIENLLVKRYGMGSLVKTTCNWEPEKGKTGTIISKRLALIDPKYSMTISMWAESDMEVNVFKGKEQEKSYYCVVIIWDEI
ncbi:DUF4952 domain-containing protein [Flavobacterium sp. HSC-61S13]|uniref:DUF4952 domain-containing protein n=1 Tax=Flavobacterium sp. HSC-61S13 TaxID=2910963 RepID=UPI00209E0328|nr:DUF4952 domain-containing protein [Flavobacterium sp. HSC-61S13]MCP1996251.1 hypothetical protein [Flavobacterium sp. HSC-61S13]